MLYFIYENDNLIGFKYNDDKYYYIKNIQEDIIGIMDNTLQQVVSYEYDSWGNILSIKDNNNNDISNDLIHIANINPFRYRSYYYDIETKLYYLNSRYYNPEWGRFINADKGAATPGVLKGATTGAVNGAVTGVASGAVLGGISSSIQVGQAANAWNSGTMNSSIKSMNYHFKKHVIEEGGLAKNIFQYTDDALNFTNRNSNLLKFTNNYNYGNQSWNFSYINGQGGQFTGAGKIITFWYK